MNYHKEVLKLMFSDGYDHKAKHGLWKLKKHLTQEEWDSVKHYFKYYNHTSNNNFTSNVKYGGWMTVEPVQVMLKLKYLHLQRKSTQEKALI